MQIRLGIFIALLSFSLLSCQSTAPVPGHKNPLEMNVDENNEGFYPLFPPQAMPAEIPAKYGFNRELIDRLATFSGILFYEYEVEVNAENFDKRIQSYCSNDSARSLNPEFCTYLETNKELCTSRGCKYKGSLPSCSGVRYRNFFITARHCMPKDAFPRDAYAKFIRADGTIRTVKLRRTILLHHRSPYDLSIFRLFGARFSDENLKLRFSKFEFREPVMGIGWPLLHVREGHQRKFDYDLEYRHHRATFGRVMQPNEMSRSFCHFTNEDGVSDIESWEMENSCKKGWHWRKEKGFTKRYYAREEHDPFLTNSDMTWGMSGSPLFDTEGRLVGIASNVLNNDPRAYNRDKYAVYVKADRLFKLLRSIEPRFDRPQTTNPGASE